MVGIGKSVVLIEFRDFACADVLIILVTIVVMTYDSLSSAGASLLHTFDSYIQFGLAFSIISKKISRENLSYYLTTIFTANFLGNFVFMLSC